MIKDACPYYDLAVTSSPAANLAWRIRVREAALRDPLLQAALRQACFADPLFFLALAGWLIEPRGDPKTVPFIPWPHQIDAILVLVKSIVEASAEAPIDVIFDKSRGQGATWICLWILLLFWLKEEMFAGGIISRSIEAVDKRNYPGSLFPKLDWAIEMLPFWLRPKGFVAKRDRSQTDHVWHNCELHGALVGTACTAEAFSGDRLSAAMYDEAAKVKQDDFQDGLNSIQHVTNTRWVVSTHYGDSGPFYDMIFDDTWTPVGEVKALGGSGVYVNPAGSYKVILDWADNPAQSRLAYRYAGGQFTAVRAAEAEGVAAYVDRIKANGNWQKLKRKGFIKEGAVRAPWLDRKCLGDGATPRHIAQDIGRDPRSTVGKMFNVEVMDAMDKQQTREPVWRGEALLHDDGLHLVEDENGPLKLWFRPGLDGQPPAGRYVVAADPGTGIDSSEAGNSTLCGGDAATGEQILEFSKQLPEARLADLAVALAEWLADALLIWEAQGTCGKRFAIRVAGEIGYWNIWKRPAVVLRGAGPRNRINSEQVGWVNNKPADKRDLFEDFWLAMQDAKFFPRSREMIAECRGWEELPSKTSGRTDVVYHGTGHGDRAIAGGLCWKAMKESENRLDNPVADSHTLENSFSLEGRLARRQAAQQEREDDDFAGFGRSFAGERW